MAGLLAIIVGAGCSAGHSSVSSEPTYDGRPLQEWLGDFNPDLLRETQAKAAEAIRHIGSPAVPFLVDCLSVARWKEYQLERQKWQDNPGTAVNSVNRPENPRYEGYAGLDALGTGASDALPALEKLLDDDPQNPTTIYVIARIGPAGVPIIKKYLGRDDNPLGTEANVCLEMINSHSEVLYPRILTGPEAPNLLRRVSEFNLKLVHAFYLKYRESRPEIDAPPDANSSPPSSINVPAH